MSKKEIGFEIVENIAIIEEFGSGWTTEMNVVKWNGKEPKIDIRNWSADHTKCSRGLTFIPSDMDKIVKAWKKYSKK